MTKIKLCELFGPTVEGEGKFIGVPFIVIRTSGCNLKCSFCIGVKKGKKMPIITIANGPNKKITDVKVGDKLLALDENGKIVETKVEEIHKNKVEEYYEIFTKEAGNLLLTADHPMMTSRGWIVAKDLQIGDEILHLEKRTKQKYWLKNYTPMKDKDLLQQKIKNTDYKKIGEKTGITIGKRIEAGNWIPPIENCKNNNPEKYKNFCNSRSEYMQNMMGNYTDKQFKERGEKHQKDFEIKRGYWWGYFIGASMGDAHINMGREIRFTLTDREFIDAINKAAEISFGEKSKVMTFREKGENNLHTYMIYFCGTKLTDIVKNTKFKDLSEEEKKGFTAGFFDAEGHTTKDLHINFYQKDPTILYEIQTYINGQGYETSLNNYIKCKGGVNQLSVLGKKKDKRKFLNWLEPKILRKRRENELVNGFKVLKIQKKEEKIQTYNFTCFPYNNFYVNNMLTHNCDTRFSSHYNNDEQEYSKEEIFNYIKGHPCKNISITGGEPFFRSKEELDALYELCKDIKSLYPAGVLKVETNTTLLDERFFGVVDFWSMSPKLKGMGEDLWFSKNIIKQITAKSKDYQLKFVIGSREKDGTMEEDLQVIKDLIIELNLEKSLIILQPEGLTENLREYLKRGEILVERIVNSNKIDWDFWQNINLQILPQWHRLLWNNSRRK